MSAGERQAEQPAPPAEQEAPPRTTRLTRWRRPALVVTGCAALLGVATLIDVWSESAPPQLQAPVGQVAPWRDAVVDEAQLARAREASVFGDWEAARAAAEQVLAGAPRHWEATRLHGTALRHLGRHADALPVLERAQAATPPSAEPRELAALEFELACALSNLGRLDEAQPHLERALFNDYPLDVARTDEALTALRARPWFDELLGRLRALHPTTGGLTAKVGMTPDLAASLVEQARSQLRQGDARGALTAAEGCTTFLPSAHQCWRLAGDARDELFRSTKDLRHRQQAHVAWARFVSRAPAAEPGVQDVVAELTARGIQVSDGRPSERALVEYLRENAGFARCLVRFAQQVPAHRDALRMSMRVTEQGAVAGPVVEDFEVQPELRGCLEAAMKNTRFPVQVTEQRVSYALPLERR